MRHDVMAPHLQAMNDAAMTHMQGFEPWMRAHDCGNSTVRGRLHHVTDFSNNYPNFPNITAADVTGWLGRPDYAQWSRATYYGHLRSYFRFALENDLIAVDPMGKMRRPKPGKCVPRPLTNAEVATVMLAAKPNVHAWLMLGLFAGLRAFEIAKIRGEDVTQERIFVIGKGGQEAYVPTHPLIWELAQVMPRTGWWFISSQSSLGHIRSVWVTTGTTQLFSACGITGSVHRMRHTYGTRLLRAGTNIRVLQTLMRHESLNSTMVYLLVDQDERREAIDLLPAA